MKRLTIIYAIGLAWLMPALAHAQVALTNPLGESDPRILVGRLIRAALSVSGTVALVMFLYGGIVWLTSMGNSELVAKGKKVLIWSILGIVVITSAYVITNAVFGALLVGDVSNPSSTEETEETTEAPTSGVCAESGVACTADYDCYDVTGWPDNSGPCVMQ